MGRLLATRAELHEQAEPIEPHLLVNGETSLHDHGVQARIIPTPGHTAGSISVLTDSGDLVAGDLIAGSFMGAIPGKPANPPFHDDPLRNLASLRAMLGLKPTLLHVGHGGPLDPIRVGRWAVKEQRRLEKLDAKNRLTTRASKTLRPPDRA
jgi:glyoxylase-like metal-dependent hydrolase (beta-lactamase superfamily II)